MKILKLSLTLGLLGGLCSCSTFKSLGDDLSLVQTKSGHSFELYDSLRSLDGYTPQQIRNYLGNPASEGVMYARNHKKYKDFVLIYPVVKGDINDKTKTIKRVSYNMNDKKRCLFIIFTSENDYRYRKNNKIVRYTGKYCSPYVDVGGLSKSRKYVEMTAEEFQKVSAHF